MTFIIPLLGQRGVQLVRMIFRYFLTENLFFLCECFLSTCKLDHYPYFCGKIESPIQCQNYEIDSDICFPRPPWDLDDGFIECVRGGNFGVKDDWVAFVVPYMMTQFSIIFIALSFVCFKAFQSQQLVKSELLNNNESDSQNSHLESLKSARRTTRIILLQTISYIAAYFLTVIFPIVSLFPRFNYEVSRKLQITFMPLQGLFNFCIFATFKIVHLRAVSSELSWWEAFRQLFSKGAEDPVIISGISEVNDRRDVLDTIERREPESSKKSRSASASKSDFYNEELSSWGFFSMFSSWFGSVPSGASYSDNES